MLVLTRKIGESIVLGGDIVVKVSDISGNRVKLCIDAPKSCRILRAEIAEESLATTASPVTSEWHGSRETGRDRAYCPPASAK